MSFFWTIPVTCELIIPLQTCVPFHLLLMGFCFVFCGLRLHEIWRCKLHNSKYDCTNDVTITHSVFCANRWHWHHRWSHLYLCISPLVLFSVLSVIPIPYSYDCFVFWLCVLWFLLFLFSLCSFLFYLLICFFRLTPLNFDFISPSVIFKSFPIYLGWTWFIHAVL